MLNAMCEEISEGRASHTQLYPPVLECVKDFYMTESDPWAAIEKLSQEIEAGFYFDKFCADTELDLASQEIIKFSLEEAEELESDIMFMSV